MSSLPSSYVPPSPQAKEKTAQEQQQHVQEQDDNYTELYNHIHGDMLTENPVVAQSAFGPNRVITDRWKGMSPSQVQEIRDTQEMQLREKEVCVCVCVCVCMWGGCGCGVCVCVGGGGVSVCVCMGVWGGCGWVGVVWVCLCGCGMGVAWVCLFAADFAL